jgi:ATP-dependent helicase/nuclease subunit A
LSLTRALLHLADRPAWLAILRAPWCGLTLADLEAIAGEDHRTTIWDLVRRPGLALSADGAPRIERLMPVLQRALERRGRVALRTLVEGAWIALGGPACLRSAADLTDAGAYLDLLEREERGGDLMDLDAFTRRVSDLFAAPDPAAPATLELMTVHRAKGLEFDCVIIPGLGRKPKRDDAKLLLWSEQPSPAGPRILLSPISARHSDTDPIYHYLRAEEDRKNKYETVRLLYVACTRARRSLHLIGHANTAEANGVTALSKPESGSFLDALWPAVQADFERAFEAHDPASEERAVEPRENILRRLPLTCAALPIGPAPPVTGARPIARQALSNTAAAVGKVVHRLLEQIGNQGLDVWTAAYIRSKRDLFKVALAMEAVPHSAITSATAEVEQALTLTVEDPRGRWILSAHEHAENEYALAGVMGGAVAHFQIDRTFIDNGVRWIVDFKTSTPDDIEAERIAYQQQLENYAALIRALDQQPIRVGLYFPLISRWLEWDPFETGARQSSEPRA